jgi:hypothetical protein
MIALHQLKMADTLLNVIQANPDKPALPADRYICILLLLNGFISRGKHLAIYLFGSNSRCFIFAMEVAKIIASKYVV